MSHTDTIAAIATGAASAERALVRVSGPAVSRVASELLGAAKSQRWAGSARFRLPAGDLPVLAIRCIAPASYTGEDTLELSMTGGTHVVLRVLEVILSVPGVRHAEPGEFSARAYLHGKLSLAQAEGVSGVIAASSAAQLEAARQVLSGRRGAEYRGWAEEIAALLARVEAGLDFSDQEDVVAIAPSELRRRVNGLLAAMQRVTGAAGGDEARTGCVRVVLAGPPSAGKSTLFNALLGRARSLVHEAPGTTRDVLVEAITLSDDVRGPITIELADLAGLDAAFARRGPIDEAAQRAASEAVERAAASGVVVWCDAEARAPIAGPATALRVRTKCDRGSGARVGWLDVCALDGRGLAALRAALYDHAWRTQGVRGTALLPRHRGAVLMAMTSLWSLASEHDRLSHELIADHLRAALDALGELTGRVERDEILGRVFASFCIGK